MRAIQLSSPVPLSVNCVPPPTACAPRTALPCVVAPCGAGSARASAMSRTRGGGSRSSPGRGMTRKPHRE
eukprot:6680103-Pyramimonas_sp.AAC.1